MQSNVRKLTYCAVLIALAVILKCYLGIPIQFLGVYAKSISLAPIAVMFAGLLMGPVYGGITGAIVDIICCIIMPMGPYFPGYTATMALYGVIPGLMLKGACENAAEKKRLFLRVLLCTTITQTVCSALLNTLWMQLLMGIPQDVVWLRILSGYVSLPVYVAVLYFLARLYVRTVKTARA